MPKETDRIVDTKTEYISRNGKIIKKVTTYSIVGNATFRVEDDTKDPTVQEFKETVLGKNKEGSKDGYVSRNY
jgi:hypothetical protein